MPPQAAAAPTSRSTNAGRVAGRPGDAARLRPQRRRAAGRPPDALGRRRSTAWSSPRSCPRRPATRATVNLTLPLRAGVDSFAVDGYPDTFPTPGGAPRSGPGRGGLLAPHPGHHHPLVVRGSHHAHGRRSPHRRQVPQHRHRVGHVRRTHAGTQVTLTAESRTQVEVGPGSGDRDAWDPGCACRSPPTSSGRLTVRQVPVGLTLPSIHVDVPGVRGGVRIDPTSAVRAFLAGERPLPNHTDGCTPVALRDAQVDGNVAGARLARPRSHGHAADAGRDRHVVRPGPLAGGSWPGRGLVPGPPPRARPASPDARTPRPARHGRRAGRAPRGVARPADVSRGPAHPRQLPPRPLGRHRPGRPRRHRGHARSRLPDRHASLCPGPSTRPRPTSRSSCPSPRTTVPRTSSRRRSSGSARVSAP